MADDDVRVSRLPNLEHVRDALEGGLHRQLSSVCSELLVEQGRGRLNDEWELRLLLYLQGAVDMAELAIKIETEGALGENELYEAKRDAFRDPQGLIW